MLEFRDVTFKYDEDDIPMMTDLSLQSTTESLYLS